jgi:hypothetical protein
MPPLKTRKIFISHAWNYSEHYWKVVEWLNEAPNFSWQNCSVPRHDSCPDDSSTVALEKCMDSQIQKADCVVIFGGMYSAYSDWIEYEIKKAYWENKTIICIKPWGQERMPQIVQDYADVIVGWNQSSVVDAIRKNS